MIKFTSLLAVGLLTASLTVRAQSPATGKPATSKPATSKPAAPAATPAATASPAAATFAPADLDTLRTHVGETVDVSGTPTGTGHSKSGSVTYLNFGKAHAAVSVVAFLKNDGGAGDPAAHKVQSEDDLKPFVGKVVIVHGKLADYKGDLQIVLDSLDQIKVAP